MGVHWPSGWLRQHVVGDMVINAVMLPVFMMGRLMGPVNEPGGHAAGKYWYSDGLAYL